MPRGEPKRKPVLLGDGKYYNPVASRGSLKHNASVAFLQAVENKTPEVLNSLHHDVRPLYESVYWRVSPPQTEEDWLYSLHLGIVAEWFSGGPTADWTPRARAALHRLKKGLFAWASNYSILAEWTIRYALDTMMFWTAYQSFPDRRRGQWHGIRLTWGIGPRWYFEKRELRRFEYPIWQGEEEDAYRDRVQQQFELHLRRYMSEIRNRASALPKIPKIRKPEQFEMLALYLCRGMNREQIATLPGYSKDITVIYRDIREAAHMIELPLRPRGRPQKKLQKKRSK
jgi:hypothetical protein